MGTLFDQPPRDERWPDQGYYEHTIEEVLDLAKKYSLPTADVIQILHVAELDRRNDMSRDNGDRWDEQIAGIGDLLRGLMDAQFQIASALHEVAESIRPSPPSQPFSLEDIANQFKRGT